MSEFRWGAAPEPELPSVVGYTILAKIGAGGMGQVFRARDEAVGREVALKLTARSRLQGASGVRFRREAELLARFRHPGVVTVYTWGETAEWLYLACELLEGAQTFGEACADLSDEEKVTLGRKTLEVLAVLHAAGVLHRDVKPANVLVTPKGAVKLVDFGIAISNELDRLTQSQAFIGTPLYSAPERIRLEGERGDPAADVWSAGAMLYEVLAGRLPFEATSYVGIVAASEEPPPSIRGLRPDLPKHVASALDQALSLEPGERPSAAEFAERLGGKASRPRGKVPHGAVAAAALVGAAFAWTLLPTSPPLSVARSGQTPRAQSPQAQGSQGQGPVPTPKPTLSQELRILESRDRGGAARLIRPLFAEGREGDLVERVGEDSAVELLALSLLPPFPEHVELPAEWRLLSARLDAGKPDLIRAVEGAMRGRPWESVAASLRSGEDAEPDAPWWILRGLLRHELMLHPEDVTEGQLAQRMGPWALQDWRALINHMRLPSARSRPLLTELALGTTDPLLRDYARARAVVDQELGGPEIPGLAKRYTRLDLRLGLHASFLDRGASSWEYVSAIDAQAPRGLRLYSSLLFLRSQRILQVVEESPTPRRLRVVERFIELSLAESESSFWHHLTLQDLALRLPALGGFVLDAAGPLGKRDPSSDDRFKELKVLARSLTPIPRVPVLPPEWKERVAALDPAAQAGVRRAVELGIWGRPWRELEAQLASAREAAPRERGVSVARALLALARGANGVLTLDEVCEGLPEDWATLVRSRWMRDASRPPDWLSSLGLEYELDRARYPSLDTARLRELAPRHSQAAFVLARAELPELLAPQLFEAFLKQLDPLLERTGALYVESLVPRTPAAWNWAQDQTAGVGLAVLDHTLLLAPDGPALLLTWARTLNPEIWRGRLVALAPRWPKSVSAQGLAGCLEALAAARAAAGAAKSGGRSPSPAALEFLDRAQALDPDWRPPKALKLRLKKELPKLWEERFAD